MTQPMTPEPRVLHVTTTPEQRARDEGLASERRRISDLKNQKLEDVLEDQIKEELARRHDRVADRINLLKVGVALLAVKHKLGPVFGGALDTEGSE